ncbi:hypothetical protein [Streptomyces sp. NBC_00887]|uniref:hypothetical protein n=1 Tax=Streptomyces sp. NBC_00887 TaxID=2975859 RepID=UPI0038653286|nr:hypothetical protein OG844_20270 [Streptomyces sp. NBC_00887]
MRGDETQPDSTGEDTRVRSGPRHAAPRKSLLTKLHMPAGKKAFALAAMPTAVFVGMGLTPKLALADDNGDIPFAPGPCVTRSDEPSESQEPEAKPTPSATSTGEADKDEEQGKDDEQGKEETTAPEPSASASAPPADGTADNKAQAAPTPTPTESENPLDPLGVGDALKDLLDGPDKETASPSPSATTEAPKPTENATTEPVDEATEPVEEAADAAKGTVDETADAIRDAADKAGKDVEELEDEAKGLDPVKDEDIPDGAKERFPCPTADPEALAAADLEQGIPLLPNDPWILESSRLTLNGLDYKGIVEVRKGDGSTKKVLKFTASSVDIKDLHQLTKGPGGTTGHVEARSGSTSTIRNGTVTMYTEELKGNLFGLIPITFSPETPPPLNVPFAFFTDVKVTQAGQFGGTLSVPGLHNYFTGGAS